ncbi:SDR family oxidoreductase [Streptomyces sp. NPDC005805]|uniref:SDR family oxidoreductase n=1 Tax=Streptomyces sp. NPDC005805 TaxID=3157068 RepID=UPI0033D0321C
MIRAYLPGMKSRGFGRVLNVASDPAVAIPAEMIHYGMSKTALLAVTRGFAKDAAGTGATGNSLIADPAHTRGVEDFVRELVGDDLPLGRGAAGVHAPPPAASLIQRLIEPEEIADMAVYLAAPLASATTVERELRLDEPLGVVQDRVHAGVHSGPADPLHDGAFDLFSVAPGGLGARSARPWRCR